MAPWDQTDRTDATARDQAAATLPGGMALDPLLSVRLLSWFVRLRWIFVLASFGVLALERFLAPGSRRPVALLIALAALAAANLVWWALAAWLERSGNADGRAGASRIRLLAFAHVQMAVDLLILTIILRFTGGVENPLAIFYVFHMALGSLLLPSSHALAQGLWAIVLYGSLALGEVLGIVRPHYPLLGSTGAANAYEQGVYAGAAVAALTCGVLGTLYFTGFIATRLRRREEELRATNVALQKSQTAIRDLQSRRSRFMQTAAHRLKSPLATIQTLASLVCDDVVHGPDAQGTCHRIVRCCDEGIAHVAELLTLARVQDADPGRHRLANADVCAVVEDQCRRFQAVADGRGIQFACRVPHGTDLRAHVDARDFADCMGNLIDNALKYTPAGGNVTVTVESGPSAEGKSPGCAVIHVKDTGIGFDAEALVEPDGDGGSIFDAYRRGNNALAAGIAGSGLGLAIVRVVVEQAGGQIDVRSKPGSGTHFKISLPTGGMQTDQLAVRDTRSTRMRIGAGPEVPFLPRQGESASEAPRESSHAHA